MSLSKYLFSFQHIQNGQLILSIPNKNGQNGHNDYKWLTHFAHPK